MKFGEARPVTVRQSGQGKARLAAARNGKTKRSKAVKVSLGMVWHVMRWFGLLRQSRLGVL